MNLYFAHAEDDDGESMDLLVEAENEAAVLRIWREYFNTEDDAEPSYIGLVETTGTEGAISWGRIIPKDWSTK